MYCHNFFVISVRGIGLFPTTAPSAASGCIGFMNAGFGARFAPPRFDPRLALRALPRAFFAPPRFAPPRLAPPRFAAFFVAILSPGRWNGVRFSLWKSLVFTLYASVLRGEKYVGRSVAQ